MASRGFFGNDYYDPFDFFYAAPPSNYPYPYHQRPQQWPAPARPADAGGFFPAGAEPAAARPRRPAAVNPKLKPRKVSIPVHFVESDTEPPVVTKKRAPSPEEAAARIQAAARGFLARRAVRALRAVEREAEEIGEKVAREAAALRGDGMLRVAVGEQLMRLLLRIDAVRGARDYRRRVAKRVLALQDAVDALEARPEPAEEPESEVTNDTSPELPGAAENCGETEAKAPAEAADVEMEVDGDRAADETEQAADGASNGGDDVSDNSDAEGEWEMVAEEPEPAPAAEEPPRQEPAGEAAGGATNGDLDAKKLMEMVAALCERTAQQCAVIGALAERVEALEGTVRRMEDAERRRRRAKKLKKEGKGSNQCYFY